MNVKEARAQYYEGRNLNAGIMYVKALEAEIERLQRVFKGVCIEAAERQDHIQKLEEAECSLTTAIIRLTLAIERSAFGGGGQEAERVKEKK